MAKVLLKHVGRKAPKEFKKDVANISKTALVDKPMHSPKIEMYSKHELIAKKKKLHSPFELGGR